MNKLTATLATTVGLISTALVSSAATPAPSTTIGSSASSTIEGYEVVALQYDLASLAGQASSFIKVDCPEGKKVLGGGAQIRDAENRLIPTVFVAESTPFGETGWIAAIAPIDASVGMPGAGTFRVNAVCATVAG